MSDQTQPPAFLPMSDEEGYYVSDPSAVFIRTDAEFRVFAVHLRALSEGVEKAESALPPEQHALAQQLKDKLAALQDNNKMLIALVRELTSYNVALTEQRKSARDAYNAGWQQRYQDILSQLHPADRRMLRWIIEHIDAASP